MKKKYTMPGIIKVELKPEQAVLGQCSAGAPLSQGAGRGCVPSTCRSFNRDTGKDDAASS